MGNDMENALSWTSKHVGSFDFKSLTNNVENNICDEVNFFFFVLISPIINNKLPPIINGIKLPYTAVNKILIFASFVWNSKIYLESLLGNRIVLFMARSKRNE